MYYDGIMSADGIKFGVLGLPEFLIAQRKPVSLSAFLVFSRFDVL